MSITKVSPDLLDLDAGITISVADNSDNLTLTSTDDDANVGPILDLNRDSGSPADSDFLGKIQFSADDDGGNKLNYAFIDSKILDASNGSEDGQIDISTIQGGSAISRLQFNTATVFNEDSADVDFRVESNGNTHALFVDGGNDCVVIGGPDQVNGGTLSISTSAEGASLSLLTRSTTEAHQCEIIMQKSSTDSGNFAATADGEALGSIKFRGVNTTTVSDIGAEIKVLQNGTASGTVPADMIFDTNETERFRLTSDGYHKFGNLPFAFVRGNDTNTRTIANNHYFFNTSESSQGAASLTGSSTLTHAGSNAIT